MHRKYLFYFAAVCYCAAFIILYFSPGAIDTLRGAIYNSDLLFPFSVYQGIFNPGSRPDWIFGGYTPVLEVLLGLLFWTLTRNIHLTFALYWLCQPMIITACLLFLERQIYGKNRAVAALVLIFSALPILAFATTRFFHLYYQFVWYGHIGTAYFGLLGLALLIRFVTAEGPLLKQRWVTLLSLCVVVILAVLSDALFITQFIAPALASLILLFFLSVVPFRKASITGLSLLYATAGGLALYQIPTLWGGQRFGLYGSYMRPTLDQIPQNVQAVLQNLMGFWSASPWMAGIWVGFYLACLGLSLYSAITWRKERQGRLRKRQITALLFFPLQMAANLSTGLITGNTELRYFQPLIFIPLFWGWPFVLAALPGWIGWLRGRRALAAGFALASATVLLLAVNAITIRSLPNLADYYPSFVACMDENTSRLGLKRGIAHYWQARTLTLLNKTGVRLVQATPELEPFRVLNNSDGYITDPFDFIILDHSAQWWNYQFDQDAIKQRFGTPAVIFTCEQSDFWVYNRPSDLAFQHPFDTLLKPGSH